MRIVVCVVGFGRDDRLRGDILLMSGSRGDGGDMPGVVSLES